MGLTKPLMSMGVFFRSPMATLLVMREVMLIVLVDTTEQATEIVRLAKQLILPTVISDGTMICIIEPAGKAFLFSITNV